MGPALLASVLLGGAARADVFTVNSTADSGDGTLRAALVGSNATAGPHEIRFALTGSPPFVITPLSPLPEVIRTVVIDGTTQAAFAGAPVVVLDGVTAGAGASGLIVSAAGCTVRGLVIQRFSYAGLWLAAGGNVVAGNYLGVGAGGTQAQGNGSAGLLVGSAGNQIGGTAVGARNVISANGWSGVYLYNGAATNNVIEGNFIGTDATGLAALGNRDRGIAVLDGVGNRIGGTAPGAGNLLSGNAISGLLLDGFTNATLVQGNWIGLNAVGQAGLGNGFEGVEIRAAHHNTVGGTLPGAGNIISGNLAAGLWVRGLAATGNSIQGNWIGTQADGVSALGNQQYGVFVSNLAHDNLIGGSGAGNVIAHNCAANINYDGVRIHDTAGVGNRVSGNAIFANHGALEIDAGLNGLSPNSPANPTFPYFPVLTCAPIRAGRATIYGTLSGAAGQTFTIELFSNASAHPTGHGSGQRFAGTTVVTTDATGLASFAIVSPAASLAGPLLAATATNAAQTTSEFSAARASSATDTDADGLPDVFEDAFQLDPNDPADAARDAEGDGASNLQEFLTATDPRDAARKLAIHSLTRPAAGPTVLFPSVAGLHYRLETTASLRLPWQTAVSDIPGTSGLLEITDPTWQGAGQAFYRIIVLP